MYRTLFFDRFVSTCWSAPSPWHVTWPIYGLAAPIQYYLCATPPSGYDPYAFNARTSYLIT
jgi:hypothetical protein